MNFTPMKLADVIRIDPAPIGDERGFFARILCKRTLTNNNMNAHIQQCNNTLTRRKGSIRGLHFQRPPKAETKFVRCVAGAILDVAIDLRAGSKTFGEYCICELTDANRSMLMIPPGFAHGFQTLTDNVELIYFHTESHSPELEGGISPFDPAVGIPWPHPVVDISERDQNLPGVSQVEPIQL